MTVRYEITVDIEVELDEDETAEELAKRMESDIRFKLDEYGFAETTVTFEENN